MKNPIYPEYVMMIKMWLGSINTNVTVGGINLHILSDKITQYAYT